MAKYISKPKIKEATQFKIGKPLPEGVHTDCDKYYVVTIHGQQSYLEDGDYVITEPDDIHH